MELPGDEPFPFRCPNAGDGGDHVVTPVLDLAHRRLPRVGSENPFVRFRNFLYSHERALAAHLSDGAFVDIVKRLDHAVAETDGAGFTITPYVAAAELGAEVGLRAGGLYVKDETQNVSGSHKARHLMGVALLLEVEDLLCREGVPDPRLVIASCGNAALGAAVVAAAAGRKLEVFVPPHAEPRVLTRLGKLGAHVVTCSRSPAGPPGDPCLHRFREAVAAGALPFTVQGSENGLTIEGCKTLGYEIVEQHAALGAPPLDRVFVQVGGGALASAVLLACRDAVRTGDVHRLPKFHTVQTQAGHPLERAWRRVAQAVAERAGETLPIGDHSIAVWLGEPSRHESVDQVLAEAARNRSRFMEPWAHEPGGPTSVATGILDDETYDWLAVVRGMIETSGWPLVVDEDTLVRAWDRARASTRIRVDATGSAGLAGLLAMHDAGAIAPEEHVAVLFTGVER